LMIPSVQNKRTVQNLYSIDELEMVGKFFISNGDKGEESKEAERQRERVCVCV